MNDYLHWRSLRELDQAAGTAKGQAFRAFKRTEPTLQEGRDFHVLNAETHRADIDTLRAQGRIYTTSIHLVMVSPQTASVLLQQLKTVAEPLR